jgi:hypothetical protein
MSLCSCQVRVIQTAASAWLIPSRFGSGSRLKTLVAAVAALFYKSLVKRVLMTPPQPTGPEPELEP